MNTLIKVASATLMCLTLANCGGGGGGSSEAGPTSPGGDISANSTVIQFDAGNGDTITWSKSKGDIYTNESGDCYDGLKSSSDDTTAQEAIAELKSLVDSSTVGTGTHDSSSPNSIYLHIQQNDGSVKTYNLSSQLASKSDATLSKGYEIIDFFENISDDFRRVCSTGKGSK